MSLNHREILAIATATAVFMPLPFGITVLALFNIWILFDGHWLKYAKELKGYRWYFSFAILELIVSAIFRNTNGLGFGVFLIGLGTYLGYLRANITHKSYKVISCIFIGLSLLMAVIGFLQYLNICSRLDIVWYLFKVQEKPNDRVYSLFMNANLYATVCEFSILFCLHRYTETKVWSHRIYYVCVACVNIGMIYLTGCRTAYLPFLLVFPVYFALRGKQKLLMASIIAEMLCLVLVNMFPNLIPRMGGFSTFTSRLKIWNSALQMIQANPLFGSGSQTYGLLYKSLAGHPAPHCHNIYLDLICSYGLTGCTLLIGYATTMWREWRSSALAIGAFIIVLVHGVLDVTINYPLTLMMFMILISVGEVHEKK